MEEPDSEAASVVDSVAVSEVPVAKVQLEDLEADSEATEVVSEVASEVKEVASEAEEASEVEEAASKADMITMVKKNIRSLLGHVQAL